MQSNKDGSPTVTHTSGTPDHELTGLHTGTLSMGTALGMAIVVFSPVLTAATVGSLVYGVAGSSAWLSALAGAVLIACVGLAIVPFARRYVVSGALYSYIGHVFGGPWKLLAGASLAVGYAVGMMVMLGILGVYAGSALSSELGWHQANSLIGQVTIYTLAIASAGILAYRSLDASARLSIGLLVVTAPVVAAVLIANVFSDGFDFVGQFRFDDFSFGGFTLGIALCATFFVGFESSSATAMETKDPIRTMPKVIILVPMIVGGIAVVATLMAVPTLGLVGDRIAAGESPIAALAHHSGMDFLASAADIALAVTCYGIVVGFMNYAPRVWATMAEDGLLPASLARINQRRQTPAVAIVALSVVSLVFLTFLAAVTQATPFEIYSNLATLFPYTWVPPYVLICVGCLVLMKREGDWSFLRVVACLIGAVGSAWVYLNSIFNPTGTSLDRMTWVAPISIVAVLVLMAWRQFIRNRSAAAR